MPGRYHSIAINVLDDAVATAYIMKMASNLAQDEDVNVVIIGAGVAGLALGNILLRRGIRCAILEKHARDYVEQRHRAGSLDATGVSTLNKWNLSEVVEGSGHHDAEPSMLMLVDGGERKWRMGPANGSDEDDEGGMFCTQQVLVRNMIRVFLRDGGDLRFGADDVTVETFETGRSGVRYRNPDGAEVHMRCDAIAGCDGYHGISRSAIPEGVIRCDNHEFGYAWLVVMTDVPAEPLVTLAIHSRGFAAQITRGPSASRVYLQCPITDVVETWSDDRIWDELEKRLGRAVTRRGTIQSKQVVPLRCVVFSPMSHGSLYLLGDAAHLISPMSAEGMSLALHDADVFARAIIRNVENGDRMLLDAYSRTCLAHTWERQASAVRITDTMHDAGDSSYQGEFRKQIARKNLEEMLEPLL